MIFEIDKLTKAKGNDIKKPLENAYINKYGPKYESLSDFKMFHIDYYVEKGVSSLATISNSNEILCFAVYKSLTIEQVIEDYETGLFSEIPDKKKLDDLLKYLPNECIYIDFIESFKPGYGKIMIHKLINEHKNIFIYSDIDATGFWEKMNFINVFGYNYIYVNKKK